MISFLHTKALLRNKLDKADEVILRNNNAKNIGIALAMARLFNAVSVQKNKPEWSSYFATMPKYLDFHSHSISPTNEKIVIRSLFLHEKQDFPTQQNLYFTIGMHPWHADKLSISEIKLLIENNINKSPIIGIGETGLDKLKGPNINIQEKVFRLHIEAAMQNNLPLIIHSVRAHNEIIQLKKEYKANNPWIIHLFCGSKQIAFDLLKQDCYLSIGHHITQQKSRISKYFHELPKEKIFLETDDFNIPIEDIYTFAAKKWKCTIESVHSQIINNLKHIINE